jgi:hypothetical protein
MKLVHKILLVVLAFLFVACGQKYKARAVVEDFIEQYALAPDELGQREFTNFDSTRVISDSLIMTMQQRHLELFHYPIPYPTVSKFRVLYHLRMNFIYKGDTLWHTFYLDEKMEQVVAVK